MTTLALPERMGNDEFLPAALFRMRIATIALMQAVQTTEQVLSLPSKTLTLPVLAYLDHCLRVVWTENEKLGPPHLPVRVDKLAALSEGLQDEILLTPVKAQCKTELGIDLGLRNSMEMHANATSSPTRP